MTSIFRGGKPKPKLDEHPFIGGPLDGAKLITNVRGMPPICIRVHMMNKIDYNAVDPNEDVESSYSVAYYTQAYRRGPNGVGVEISYAPAHPQEIEGFRNEEVNQEALNIPKEEDHK